MHKDNFDMTTFCRNNFTYSFMLVMCLLCTGFSLVVVNSGYTVVAVQELLTAVALLVVEQGVYSIRSSFRSCHILAQ